MDGPLNAKSDGTDRQPAPNGCAPARTSHCQQPTFVSLAELSLRTGLSASTIHRLKDQGKIRFFQPGGKRGRVLFPLDAIEHACQAPPTSASFVEGPKRLSGPPPAWTKPLLLPNQETSNASQIK